MWAGRGQCSVVIDRLFRHPILCILVFRISDPRFNFFSLRSFSFVSVRSMPQGCPYMSGCIAGDSNHCIGTAVTYCGKLISWHGTPYCFKAEMWIHSEWRQTDCGWLHQPIWRHVFWSMAYNVWPVKQNASNPERVYGKSLTGLASTEVKDHTRLRRPCNWSLEYRNWLL